MQNVVSVKVARMAHNYPKAPHQEEHTLISTVIHATSVTFQCTDTNTTQ
jgi:hypothetical protein